jgi:stage II sporulation protein D
VSVTGGEVTFEGRGFGHGVGLSQWGAYRMAEEGRTAQQILQKYFHGVGIVELW